MLEVEKVDLYYGAAIALRQVSIKAEAGAVTCVMGRNGVGKTS
jgi:urea transport system ATP-binding protein